METRIAVSLLVCGILLTPSHPTSPLPCSWLLQCGGCGYIVNCRSGPLQWQSCLLLLFQTQDFLWLDLCCCWVQNKVCKEEAPTDWKGKTDGINQTYRMGGWRKKRGEENLESDCGALILGHAWKCYFLPVTFTGAALWLSADCQQRSEGAFCILWERSSLEQAWCCMVWATASKPLAEGVVLPWNFGRASCHLETMRCEMHPLLY